MAKQWPVQAVFVLLLLSGLGAPSALARPPLVVRCGGSFGSEGGGVSATAVLTEATPRWLRQLATRDRHRLHGHALRSLARSTHPGETAACVEARAVAWVALRWRWPRPGEEGEGYENGKQEVVLKADRQEYECSRFDLREGPSPPDEWRCASAPFEVSFEERFDNSPAGNGGPVIQADCEAAYRHRATDKHPPAYCQV